MTQYGEYLNAFDPDKDMIYKLIDIYFDSPTLYKYKDTNDGHSVYITRVSCLLGNEYRYLIAVVKKDNMSIRHKEKLSNLYWVSFQTRKLNEIEMLSGLPEHSYQVKQRGYQNKIELTNKNNLTSIYKTNIPIIITLLHNQSEYQDNGFLNSALETYQTIITFSYV